MGGHGRIVEYMKNKYNHGGVGAVPMLVVGGGGYNIKNVSRAWCYETAVICNQHKTMSNTIPYGDFGKYFKPNFKLHVDSVPSMQNKNTRKYLEDMTGKILQQIKNIEIAPSIQINSERIEPLYSISGQNDIAMNEDNEAEIAESNPDLKVTDVPIFNDQYVVPINEFYQDDQDQDITMDQTK